MAEINSGSRKNPSGVDVTAMVDVAFLLLTFFILTTTLSGPFQINLVKPPPPDEFPKGLTQEKLLTLILGADDQVHYYRGFIEGRFETTDFGPEGIRKVIQGHLHWREGLCEGAPDGNCWDPIFVLKASGSCRFKNLVDVIDEFRITGAKKYSFTEASPAEEKMLHLAHLP